MPLRSVPDFANSIAPFEANAIRLRFTEETRRRGLNLGDEAVELAALLGVVYPAITAGILGSPEEFLALVGERIDSSRDVAVFRHKIGNSLGQYPGLFAGHRGGGGAPPDGLGGAVRRELRRFARSEKWRIALREALQGRAGDVDVTARELSDLAQVCIEAALREALDWADARYGVPTTHGGLRCSMVVLGMGKLGGRELNAGSDIDLLVLYETDEGEVITPAGGSSCSLHEYFTRVTQRFVATLDEVTDEGVVWRVDMRLRPEGPAGPLVNAAAAAERYYETWGRTWERAALLRARPLAGDLDLGDQILRTLSPFIWRREVNPSLAGEMFALVLRSRAELSGDPPSDLKYGPGGIREAEFFVQSLQLIWGGREPTVRRSNTLEALRRLRARGLVTEREGRDMADAYRTLRRLEHRVQFATGLQTHNLPEGADARHRLARSLGCESWDTLMVTVDKARRHVERRFASLRVDHRDSQKVRDEELTRQRIYSALDSHDEAVLRACLAAEYGEEVASDLARHLLSLARHMGAPLGSAMRASHPNFGPCLFDALAGAADPEQAARLLSAFFSRRSMAAIYTRAFAEDPRALRRLVTLFGASAFLGQTIAGHPQLADVILFEPRVPDPAMIRRMVDEELRLLSEFADADAFVGGLRRAKREALMRIALSDLAGDIDLAGCGQCLSALAESSLEKSLAFALRERAMTTATGIALLAMGKLGGREVGYGSDLDLIFVYDASQPPLPERTDSSQDASIRSDNAFECFIPIAQRVLRLVNTPHGEGPGYELDTRLRPSGSQGLLVISLHHFARYHGLMSAAADVSEARAHDWERQALLKARFIGGDPSVGAQAIALAHRAAYEGPAPPSPEVHRLRMRLQREVSAERRGGDRARYDIKLGYGGMVDVEFAVQWLQMNYGRDHRIRTTETDAAIASLKAHGYLRPESAGIFQEGYTFLRKLDQRLRVLHGTSAQLIERGAPGLTILARRMGLDDGPWGTAGEALIARYESTTQNVRAAYNSILGISPDRETPQSRLQR